MPYPIPYVVYRYPAAIVVIYAFFRFIAFADKRRAVQLQEVGLFHPIRDGAFLLCAHAHIRELGTGLGWVQSPAPIELGVLAWALLLIGFYAPRQPEGLLGRLVNLLSFVPTQNRAIFCQGLVISGALGVLGTFTPTAQIVWLTIPLFVTVLYVRRGQS